MSEENKDEQPEQEDQEKEVPEVDIEKISGSIFEKIKGFFKKENSAENKAERENSDEKGEDGADTDLDKQVDAKVNEILDAIKPKLKKEKEKELQEKELNIVLDSKVDPKFKEFMKFELKKEGADIDEILKENPQYAKKENPLNSTTTSHVSGTGLSTEDQNRYEFLKRNGGL